MSGNILRTAKDIHQIDIDRYLDQLAVNFLPKDMGHLRVINRDWNDLETDRLKITGNVERRLACLRLDFDPKHGDSCRGRE